MNEQESKKAEKLSPCGEPRGSGAFRAALRCSLPVLFAYVPIGFAFGFLLAKAGLPWIWAPVMSLSIFAGAAQFAAIGMITAEKAPLEMGLAVLLINARHIVYGFSLLERFSQFRKFRPYLIFGLTDETYGLLTSNNPPEGADPGRFDFFVTLLNQSYWVTGSTIGAIGGTVIAPPIPGLEFAMTALFAVLLIEQIHALKRPAPFLIALGVCTALYFLQLGNQSLLLGIIGSAAGCCFLKLHTAGKKREADNA